MEKRIEIINARSTEELRKEVNNFLRNRDAEKIVSIQTSDTEVCTLRSSKEKMFYCTIVYLVNAEKR